MNRFLPICVRNSYKGNPQSPKRNEILWEISYLKYVLFTGDQIDLISLAAYAIQSSTHTHDSDEGRAVDGYVTGHHGVHRCACTSQWTSDPWWLIGLQDRYAITEVWMQNRNDCCGRLFYLNLFSPFSHSVQSVNQHSDLVIYLFAVIYIAHFPYFKAQMRCTGYEMARCKGTQASHLYEESMHTLYTIQ